jgi:hypothetical protein
MYINIYIFIHYYIMTFRMKPNINIMKLLRDSNYNFINYNKNRNTSNNSFLFSDNKKITINMAQAFPDDDDDSNNNNNQIILHKVYNVVWNLHVYVIQCIVNWKLRARTFFYI